MKLFTPYCVTVRYTLFISSLIFLISCSNENKQNPGHEFMPDMYRSPSYETYSENPIYSNGMSARVPAKNTIPRGYEPYIYPNTNQGYEAAGLELKNPLESTEESLADGKQLYLDFCSHCHGETGTGDGKMVQLELFPPPPSFSSALKELPEGKMFHSITYGKNLMGSHASQLNTEERWKIILFLKTLQH